MTLNAILPLVAVALLPGMLIGAAAGLRGWLLAAAGPLLTFGIVGTAGTLLPLLGVRWSPLTLGGSAIVVAGAALLGRRTLAARFPADPPAAEERPRWSASQQFAVTAAVAATAVVGAVNGWLATRGLTAMPQWWDAYWHMNAITYIAETGESAPSALRALNEPVTAGFFYPNGFHVIGATVVSLTGVSAIAAIDAVVVVLPGAFALGLVALLRSCQTRPALAAATALLGGAFTAFPYDVIAWGPLFPYATGVALIPSLLGAV